MLKLGRPDKMSVGFAPHQRDIALVDEFVMIFHAYDEMVSFTAKGTAAQTVQAAFDAAEASLGAAGLQKESRRAAEREARSMDLPSVSGGDEFHTPGEASVPAHADRAHEPWWRAIERHPALTTFAVGVLAVIVAIIIAVLS